MTRYIDAHAALVFKQVKRVLREYPTVPLGAFVGLVGPALFGKKCRREDGVVRDCLHALVAKAHRLFAVEVNIELIERILEAAEPQANRTVAHV